MSCEHPYLFFHLESFPALPSPELSCAWERSLREELISEGLSPEIRREEGKGEYILRIAQRLPDGSLSRFKAHVGFYAGEGKDEGKIMVGIHDPDTLIHKTFPILLHGMMLLPQILAGEIRKTISKF